MFCFVFIIIKNRVVEEVHLWFTKAHSGVVISLSGVLKTHPAATEAPLVAMGAHPVDEESHPLAMSARPEYVETTTRAIEAHLALWGSPWSHRHLNSTGDIEAHSVEVALIL
jgi:hypothetical protein